MTAMLVSCKTDLEQVDALTVKPKIPDTVTDTFYMERIDSGKVTLRMWAGRLVLVPNSKDRKKTDKDASGGVKILMYVPGTDQVRTRMTAEHVIHYEANGLAEALGNVVVVNEGRDTIATERLVWDERKHIFYTDLYARIVRDGDIMMPEKGFEADENFRWYNLFNSKGDISIEDSLSREDPLTAVEGDSLGTTSGTVPTIPATRPDPRYNSGQAADIRRNMDSLNRLSPAPQGAAIPDSLRKRGRIGTSGDVW